MSEIFQDLVDPYLGPGFCCAVSCKFFHYEPFHKPIQGCKGFENFKTIKPNNTMVDPNFSLHYFMDFASNEKWKCHNKKCLISWSEPFHCQGDSRCISFPKFCEYFSISFMSDAKSEDKFSNKMMNNKIHSHEFHPDCPDLPYLTDNSDSESEMDVKEQ